MMTEEERRDCPTIAAAVRLLTDAGVLRWQRSTIVVKDRKAWEAKLRLDVSPEEDTDTGYMLTIGPEPQLDEETDDGGPLWREYEGDDVVALAAYLETTTDDEKALHRMGESGS